MARVTRDGYEVGGLDSTFFGMVHQFLPLASGAVQATDSIGIDGSADFLIERQVAVADSLQAAVTFMTAPGDLLDDSEQFLSQYGAGGQPIVLASPYVVPKGGTFTCIATDRQLVAAANSLRILHIGRKRYMQPFMTRRRYTKLRPFRLTANFTDNGINAAGDLATGATGQASINISSEWDCEIRKMVIVCDGPFTLQAQIAGSGRQWFNRAVHSSLLGATPISGANPPAGSWPFILTVPEYLPATGGLQLTVADLGLSPTYPNRIKISFLVNRMYPAGGLPLV